MTKRELPLFPLNVVLFPGMQLPLHIFEERYKVMIGTCMVTDKTFGVALISSGEEVGGRAEVREIGTAARIVHIDRLPDGRMNLLAVGVERFRILARLDDQPYAVGKVEALPELPGEQLDGLEQRVAQRFRRYLLSQGLSDDEVAKLDLPTDPVSLSYVVAATLRLPVTDRQQLLEENFAAVRLRRELAFLDWATSGPPRVNVGSFSVN
jgi:Lon protease-like protein